MKGMTCAGCCLTTMGMARGAGGRATVSLSTKSSTSCPQIFAMLTFVMMVYANREKQIGDFDFLLFVIQGMAQSPVR